MFMHGPTFMGNPFGLCRGECFAGFDQKLRFDNHDRADSGPAERELAPAREFPNVTDVMCVGCYWCGGGDEGNP